MNSGVCVLTNNSKKSMKGVIYFDQKNKDSDVLITLDLSGFPPGYHGFHIHEAGDLTEGCSSACAHFNPFHKNHGGPQDKDRHVGDLGNIYVDDKGNCKAKFTDHLITLKGKHSIFWKCVFSANIPLFILVVLCRTCYLSAKRKYERRLSFTE